ncbi:MAG: STAS domain-containing protein, partial [Thiomargarita sp.]|nr:STAS domain-containing protein [Thiomargarita sp.]
MSQIVVENENTWRLTGTLSFANVPTLLAELLKSSLVSKGGTLDLRDVTRTDSAGLALLIELRSKNVPITFQNIPVQMQSLANVSGVQELL